MHNTQTSTPTCTPTPGVQVLRALNPTTLVRTSTCRTCQNTLHLNSNGTWQHTDQPLHTSSRILRTTRTRQPLLVTPKA